MFAVVGEMIPPSVMIKAFTCGNLVTSFSRLSQVPQDVVRVHIHQPTDQPQ